MVTAQKRKTSLSLDAALLDRARDLGLNVSALTDAALRAAIAEAERAAWLQENAAALEAQARWHSENGHPLAAIMTDWARSSWKT